MISRLEWLHSKKIDNVISNLIYLAAIETIKNVQMQQEFIESLIIREDNNDLLFFKHNLITLGIKRISLKNKLLNHYLLKVVKSLPSELKRIVIDAELAVKN